MTLQTDLLATASSLVETASKLIEMANQIGANPIAPSAPSTSASNAFPADPGSAPFPSSENSASIPLDGKITGEPYLRSSLGGIWRFDKDASGNLIPLTSQYGTGFQASVNGQPIAAVPINQLIVRQGIIYFKHEGVVWGVLEQVDSPNSGIQNTVLPPPWVTTGTVAGSQTVALPAMPTPPLPTAIAPGSTGKAITFGSTLASFPDLQTAHDAANPGDTLVYDGPGGAVQPWTLAITKPLLIDGAGRATNPGLPTAGYMPGLILDVSPLADPTGYPHQLGALVPMTDCVIKGFQITGAGMKESTHGGTAAIRMGAAGNLVVDHCHLFKNQNGIGPSGFPHTIVVTNTILLDNGLGPADGGSHNVYAANGPAGGCVSATFGPGVTSIVTQGGGGGHAIKSRANVTKLIAPFYLYAADSSPLDIPDGSTQVAEIGAGTLVKKSGDANHVLIGYGVESETNGLAGVTVDAGATLDTECDSPLIQTTGNITLALGVIFKGTKPTVQGGGTVKGL